MSIKGCQEIRGTWDMYKGEVTDENKYSGHYRKQNRGYVEFKLKMDMPTFNGTLHIENFIEWMIEVERFFDYMNIEGGK